MFQNAGVLSKLCTFESLICPSCSVIWPMNLLERWQTWTSAYIGGGKRGCIGDCTTNSLEKYCSYHNGVCTLIFRQQKIFIRAEELWAGLNETII